ncbi:hypothetical protein LARI1_G009439 [Lachnellula arida]|uniref:Uncharacterized protein n=1 Tax=Lachnellula arida TaxID=1316785 RepID=A0A8T9AYZ0_9HELO|nr:hypothetical protein LARI1_G009439 [Lachnellula arida]
MPDYETACIALEELWTLVILPDIAVDQSITLPHAAQKLLRKIASEFTHNERLLLCYIKAAFSSDSWGFYSKAFGDEDTMRRCMESPLLEYNLQTGDDITIEDAFSCFIHLKEATRKKLEEREYQLDIHQTICRPTIPTLPHETHIELLINPICDFCLACMSDIRSDLKRPLLKAWLMREGSEHMSRSIYELGRITRYPRQTVSLERANRLATVAFCGLVVQDRKQDMKPRKGFRYLSEREVIERRLFVTSLTQLGFIEAKRKPDKEKHIDMSRFGQVWDFLGDGVKLTLPRRANTVKKFTLSRRANPQSHVWKATASLFQGLEVTK